MVALFFPKVYLVKSKFWPFLKLSLAFFSYKLLATLVGMPTEIIFKNPPLMCVFLSTYFEKQEGG